VPILIAASLLEPAGGQQEAALFVLDLTERKQSERDALLVRLDDEIRPLTDSDAILQTGIRLLAEYLGINPAGPFALDFAAAMQPHASGQPFCLQAPRPWLPAEMVLQQLVVNRCREAAERGRITRDLQDSERRLRLSQRAARIGSYEWLPKEGRVIWTPELEALFGLREGEFEGNFDGWAKRATPEDAQRLGAELQACLASRQTEYSCEFRAALPDGKRRWLYAYIQLFYDEAGVFERALGVNMDIDARKHAENSLNRQRQIFDGAFSHSPDHYYTFDLEGRVTYANRALLSIWRKPLEEVLGKNFFELDYTAEMAALLSSQIQQVISTGKHLKDQTAYTAADGNSKHYDYVFLPVFNSDGQVEAVAGSTRDISEQARAAELLEQDRRRWRDLLLQTPAAIAVLRGPEHHYEWFNDGYLRLVGRSAEALNGKGLREALPELISQGFADIFDRAYQTGVPYVNHEAHAFLGENGVNEMYVDFVCLPTRDSEGQVDGVFVHATDITDAVMARRLLEESERRYRFLAESMPQMVWTATSEGVLDYASRQAAAPSPSGWLSGIHPEDESRALELWSDCVRTRSPYQNEMRLRYALTEDWHWFLVRALPMNAPEGGVICWVGTCTDIQYQKQAEDALRKANRELEEFAYVASHDLQEPLRMVSVYTHLLRKGLGADADATLIHYAGVVLQCVSRMEALIHDILEFSRVAHSEEPSGEKADLAASFTEALLVLKNRIEEKGAVISAPQRLPVVRGETQHLTHVFQNLLSNALKYSKKEEPPAIEILSRRDGDNWIISVADNGIGFDQQYAARIFGLFKRLHKTEYPGTGLGLAICQRIVERYGGRMWAEGHSGEGAVFSFALPCADD
jgi:PAS domain S-box-containing protein